MALQQNYELNLAWQLIVNTNTSVFLTGRAGTGKTTFLEKLRSLSPKRMVVLAPTGVAAINAKGQTIHSFFQLPFGPLVPGMEREQKKAFRISEEKKKLIRTLDLLVIDEISMVRCDLLDAIDVEMRRFRDHSKPFGGAQLLLIGDLQQLSPVAKESEWQLLSPFYGTQYFFSSKALNLTRYVTVELKQIFRQRDEEFISMLNQIRNNALDSQTLGRLNARYIENFEPPKDEDWIRLTTHNRMADDYNERQLEALGGRRHTFKAQVSGNFPSTSFPAQSELILKVGAQVMFVKNDTSSSRRYFNGKIGIVEDFTDDGIVIFSKTDGRHITLERALWENTRYVIDSQTKEIREEVEGTFCQYPLRLAWAITVHKSQGLTFERAVLDIQDSFAHGQSYVALSRCRTLEGVVLARPVSASSIITDRNVNAYIDKELLAAQDAAEQLPLLVRQYFISLLDEAFSIEPLLADLRHLFRISSEHLFKSSPHYIENLSLALSQLEGELQSVVQKFARQYRNIAEGETLQQRIRAGANYFLQKICQIFESIIEGPQSAVNNKQVAKQLSNALDALSLSYQIKKGVFEALKEEGFSIQGYLKAKAHAALLDESPTESRRPTSKKKLKRTAPDFETDGPETAEQEAWAEQTAELFEELSKLRYQIAQEIKMPPFFIFSNKTLLALSSLRPTTLEEFLEIYGVSNFKAERYGSRFLQIIRSYVEKWAE